jgi:prevent-host-death family protein
MMRSVSAADAHRHFSRIIREVAAGEIVVVTSRGRPMIEIRPVTTNKVGDEAAFKALMTRLRSQPARNLPRATRDDMHG